MTYLSETHPFAMSIGNTQTGLSVCYGECQLVAVLVVAINYMSYETDQPCSDVLIVPHPDAETVEVVDCSGLPAAAFVREVTIGGICACPSPRTFQGTPQSFDCQPLPVESKTWGAVKALYRN